MHILVTNDDGPPSQAASPYILPFVQHLEKQGHTISVIVPDIQRSWIGKAHLVGQPISTKAYWPPSKTPDSHSDDISQPPRDKNGDTYPWILVNSTPATCVQIGISHFFQDRPPIDLVISGPNFGRNTTAVFALSSGTLGAALEASVCGFRALALSFAFFDRNHDAAVTDEACTQAVKVCEWLARNATWGGARLYSINVPVKKGVGGNKISWTRMLQNQWRKGACFQEVEGERQGEGDPEVEEERLRKKGETTANASVDGEDGDVKGDERDVVRHFKWAPRFTDVFDSVEKAGPGSDGWAVKAGETSVTAIFANYRHVDGLEGEIDLGSDTAMANM